jgi:nucleotide-binding universal stress UspA family protein
MRVMVWLAEGTWEAGVDAARRFAPADAEVALLHVIDPRLANGVHAAYVGLLGRGRGADVDPSQAVSAMAEAAERELFEAASARLGRPVLLMRRRGPVEREVVAAAANADLLVAARDGDHTRLGPHSLAPPTRFVVDHAACPMLLVWPDQTPSLATIPPPPPQPGKTRPPGPPPGAPPQPGAHL